MHFTKMEGLGNDYIIFDCTKELKIDNPNEFEFVVKHLPRKNTQGPMASQAKTQTFKEESLIPNKLFQKLEGKEMLSNLPKTL